MPLDDHFEALMDAADKQRPPPAPPRPVATAQPFRALGHDRGVYYFWAGGPMQVVALKAKDLHAAPELNRLATLAWWEANFPGRKESFEVRAAGSALMDQCHALGIYDPDNLRGRGVWYDDGRVVAHLGDRLLVDGAATVLGDLASRYVYEQRRRIAVGSSGALPAPLTDAEGKAIVECCRALAWEDPARDGSLLAGWIACAIIGGALEWRPHGWITSEAGSGKSWVFRNILRVLIGDFGAHLEGASTEAGIKGVLRGDVLPVCFDEGETQNDKARQRMQEVLDMARQSASADSGAIAKGTIDGGARLQIVRSAFMIGSVNLGLYQAADESRFITFALGAGDDAQFTRLKDLHAKAMVPQVKERLFVRLLGLVPVIRANAEMLAQAISRAGAGRRAGDVLGAAMAGGLAMTSSAALTAAQADRLVQKHAWLRLEAERRVVDPEWRRALAHLMNWPARFVSEGGRPEAASVAELAETVQANNIEKTSRHKVCDDTLRRIGLRITNDAVHGDELRIANRAPGVDEVFKGTPWAVGWLNTLARAPGARRDVATRFHKLSGMSKAIAIPLSLLTFEEPAPRPEDNDVPIL
jgi:putative DNA primase/helicase